MPNATATVIQDDFFVLSSLPPSRAQKRLAIAVVIGILAVFFMITGPLSGIRPGPIAAFLPAYLTAMFVNDSITAILLFAQFSILRSRAILVIASGYLFTALILIPYILTFPGVFVPGGLMGGRPDRNVAGVSAGPMAGRRVCRYHVFVPWKRI